MASDNFTIHKYKYLAKNNKVSPKCCTTSLLFSKQWMLTKTESIIIKNITTRDYNHQLCILALLLCATHS